MFKGGFREASQNEIEMPDCRYQSFRAMLEYIYAGTLPKISFQSHDFNGGAQDGLGWGVEERNQLEKVVELLELSDQFLLHHLKQEVERILRKAISIDTQDYLLEMSDRCNARQLLNLVKHFKRNQRHFDDY